MPKAFLSKLRPPWYDRHAAAESKRNPALPRTRRSYFNYLSCVRWRAGEFDDVLVCPSDIVGLKGHEDSFHRRIDQFPEYHRRPRIQKVTSAWKNPDAISPISIDTLAEGLAAHRQQVARKQARANLAKQSPHGPNAMMQKCLASSGIEPSDAEQQRIQDCRRSSHNTVYVTDEIPGELPTAQESASAVSQSDQVQSKPMESEQASSHAHAHPHFQEDACTPSPSTEDKDEKMTSDKKLWSSARRSVMSITTDSEPYQELVAWCLSRHMHMVALWHVLDSDKNMTVVKKEFVVGMRSLSYPHNLEALWVSLDRDHTGTLSFMEFAPENSLDLARFKHWALETFGSLTKMFSAFDGDGNGRITFAEFKESCISHGLPKRLEGCIRILFLLVDDPFDYSSKGVITPEEMGFLERWQCPVYLREKPDVAARMQFQNALLERHGGNPIAAWRTDLDKDTSMRVNFQEFVWACKCLGRSGMPQANPERGVVGLYCAFDTNRSGWFSLWDWDQPSHAALSSFTLWTRRKHGKVADFIRALEETPGAGIDLHTLRRGIKDSGIDSDATVLIFQGLASNRHKKGVTQLKKSTEDCRLHVMDVIFLDRWRLEDESKANACWTKKAFARMGTWLA